MEYFPFGETWVEEASNTERTPYLFTSKELDRETGLYYYGARYMDPRTGVWQSPDPILGKYFPVFPTKENEIKKLKKNPLYYWIKKLPAQGGVFKPSNLNLFAYSYQNPVKYIDPDGRHPVVTIVRVVGQRVAPLLNRVGRAIQRGWNKIFSNSQQVGRAAEIAKRFSNDPYRRYICSGLKNLNQFF